MSENRVGEDHHRYDRERRDCDWCGEEYETVPSKDAEYCSYTCWVGRVRESAEATNEKRRVECDWCGDEYGAIDRVIKRSEHNFCSDDCSREWRSERYSGDSHPQWGGGSPKSMGSGWDRIRRETIEKSDGCRVCGEEDELEAHHVIPRRKYMGADGEVAAEANEDKNLVALCPGHHREWEGIPVVPM